MFGTHRNKINRGIKYLQLLIILKYDRKKLFFFVVVKNIIYRKIQTDYFSFDNEAKYRQFPRNYFGY